MRRPQSSGAAAVLRGLGRNIFGLAAIIFGVIALTSGDFNNWQPLYGIKFVPLREGLLYATALAQILGGIAVQRKASVRAGAGLLLAVDLLFSMFRVPKIIAAPLVYAGWGGLSENLAIVAGAILLLAAATPEDRPWRPRALTAGWALFGACTLSFMFYQAFYIPDTASLVPKWIPPGQLFWAILTTIAFGLAAIAIFLRRMDVLATRLLTLMFLGFQVLIWIPALEGHPRSPMLWAANAQNLAIAASAWIFADFVSRY